MSDERWNNKPANDELGSLAQSARKSGLTQARNILIIIGVLNAIGALFFYANADKEAQQVIEEEKKAAGPMVTFDPVEVKKAEEELARVARLIYMGVVGAGGLFVVLGLAVHKAPVPCTVTGLVLFLGLNALAIAADPMNLVRGVILKVIFLVGLVKAVQGATAYERERKAELAARRQSRDASDSDTSAAAEFQGFGDGPEAR